MTVKVAGPGLRAGPATKRILVCPKCKTKTAVAAAETGHVRCGCGRTRRIR